MVLRVVLRVSCVCFVLFNIAAAYPPQKSQSGGSGFFRGGSSSGSGFQGSGSSTSGSGFLGGSGSGLGYLGGSGSGFSTGSGLSSGGSGSFGPGIGDVYAEIESMRPDRPGPQFVWNSDHVATGMFAGEPMNAVSHVVHYTSGYQRQRDGRTDSKYIKDAFGHILLPEMQKGGHSKTGSEGKFY